MLLVASLGSLGLSAGSVVMFGQEAPARLLDLLSSVAVFSTFVAICSAEARFGS